jgi:hypothetical protein
MSDHRTIDGWRWIPWSYDPHLPLDEQPSRLWRWSPWAFVLLALVILLVAVCA